MEGQDLGIETEDYKGIMHLRKGDPGITNGNPEKNAAGKAAFDAFNTWMSAYHSGIDVGKES
jgi:hypothetical protein